MNAITYALKQLSYYISPEMLELGFIRDEDRRGFIPVSVESKVRSIIIDGKVMVDCNLFHGTTMNIPLRGLPTNRLNDYSVVYEIPKSMTGGRRIMSALSVSYGGTYPVSAAYYNYPTSSQLMQAAGQLANSHSPIPLVSSAGVNLVGENTVQITDSAIIPHELWLNCRVENDSQMNHLQPANYESFAQLVILATKAWLYHNLKIKLDVGRIHGGMELGRLREELDSFSEANREYKEHLDEEFSQVSVMNDSIEHEQYLRLIVGGGY